MANWAVRRPAPPAGVAVGPSGDLYISDTGHHEVRVVGTDGVIHDFAGDGVLGSNGDGGSDQGRDRPPGGFGT